MIRGYSICLAAVAAAVPVAGANAGSFNPSRDAAQLAECFGTYQELAHAAFGLKPQRDSDIYKAQSYRGSKRSEPLIAESERAVGARGFYDQSAKDHLGIDLALNALDAIPLNPLRANVARSLAVDATKCDRELDAWGAPAFLGLPPSR